MVWEYVFWLISAALVVIGLGRLKRWLLALAFRRPRVDVGIDPNDPLRPKGRGKGRKFTEM